MVKRRIHTRTVVTHLLSFLSPLSRTRLSAPNNALLHTPLVVYPPFLGSCSVFNPRRRSVVSLCCFRSVHVVLMQHPRRVSVSRWERGHHQLSPAFHSPTFSTRNLHRRLSMDIRKRYAGYSIGEKTGKRMLDGLYARVVVLWRYGDSVDQRLPGLGKLAPKSRYVFSFLYYNSDHIVDRFTDDCRC